MENNDHIWMMIWQKCIPIWNDIFFKNNNDYNHTNDYSHDHYHDNDSNNNEDNDNW